MSSSIVSNMLDIPAGKFIRGSDESPDEQPVQEIAMDGFRIDRDPVTNAQYAEFIQDGGYHNPILWTPMGWKFILGLGAQEPNYWNDPVWSEDLGVPVTGVSWWEALAFARWAGKMLPTEAQWEYSCRGPNGNTYPWGEEYPDSTYANYAPEGEPIERRPTRPESYPRNISCFGCRDLAGNFSEWCIDNYIIGYKDLPTQNPIYVSSEADDHIVRGGCGLHDEDYMRCSARDHYRPELRDNLIGFRCVRPL